MKKLLIALVILPALLLAACASPPSLIIPMADRNIAQLQPEQLVSEAAVFLGVAPEELFVPAENFPKPWLNAEFEWITFPDVSLVFAHEAHHDAPQYLSLLEVYRRISSFCIRVVPPWQNQYPLQPLHRLQDVLDAWHYLPQQHILNMVYPPADGFMLDIMMADSAYITDRPEVIYSRHGVIEQLAGEYIRLSLLPMYAADFVDNDSSDAISSYSHQGDGANLIYLLFALE